MFALTWSTIAASVVDLPEPVGPVHEDQPARPVRHFGEDLRRVQLLERKHFRRNGPERGGGAARLHERIDPEAGEVRAPRS